ncbi:MAG: CDP-alcohol phosphatidyltransferase family protein, partial [Magnetococcales bacterium]|nr:CDP-alcohol phosphatidyltransferase family protein [Magnetococcales bacterium]
MMKNLPNILTVGRIILAVIMLYFLPKEGLFPKFISAMLFAVAAITDFFDGYIARK